MPQDQALASDNEDDEEEIFQDDFGKDFHVQFGLTTTSESESATTESESESATTSASATASARLEKRLAKIISVQEQVNVNQGKASNQMLSRQARLLGEVDVNSHVILFVSEFDKGLTDAPYLLCQVIKIKDTCYKLACEAGVLSNYFHRNAFQLGSNNVIYPEMNMTQKISVREAVAKLSLGTGQGVIRCDCKGACQRNCTCKKNSLLCKSRCHQKSSNCANK